MKEQSIKEILTFKRPCIILPHYGEFGWFIIRYIRLVNCIRSPKKIVCCNKREEVYFPSANKFYYKWRNPTKDEHKKGYRDYNAKKEKDKLILHLRSKYPKYIIIDTGVMDHPETFNIDKNLQSIKDYEKYICEIYYNDFPLKYKKLGLKTDITIAARNRNRSKWREVPSTTWNFIEELLSKNNFNFSVIGKKETSHEIKNANYYSWNFKYFNDAAIELIKSSKLFISMDSGPAHLAKFLNKKMITIGRTFSPYSHYLYKPFKKNVILIDTEIEKRILKKINENF
jgi:hypothetical protein